MTVQEVGGPLPQLYPEEWRNIPNPSHWEVVTDQNGPELSRMITMYVKIIIAT